MTSLGKCEHDGKEVFLYTITSSSGAYATVSSYGATITSLWVPDSAGTLGDVLLGYDTLKGYEDHVVSMGQTVGRFANRIAKGKFTLDDKEYTLVQNNGTNCLHGGKWSFDNLTWDLVSSSANSVSFKYESSDMEEGFPGKVVTTVEFTLVSSGKDTVLQIRYKAETDKPTVVNLTNHAYFNLRAHAGEEEHPTVLDHVVTINSDHFLDVDADCIPVGEPCSVTETPLDFRAPTRIGERIDLAHSQLVYCNGYDHCFVLANGEPKSTPAGTPQGMRSLGVEFAEDGQPRKTRKPDAVLFEPQSGRTMETFTEEPGVHFFTDNIPNDVLSLGGPGKQGVRSYTYRTGCCFETQHYPDSPNQPRFPSTVLRPGAAYQSQTVYWFSAA